METEVDGFAQFAKGRQRALQQTAWLLTGTGRWPSSVGTVKSQSVRSLDKLRAVLGDPAAEHGPPDHPPPPRPDETRSARHG